LKWVRERKTPSAMVERQMLPRQTKRTETLFGGEESAIVVVLRVWYWVCFGRLRTRGCSCEGWR
jgi:hypothetical protein